MLELGKNNLFIIEKFFYGANEVLDFYDLDGINWIYIHAGFSQLSGFIKNRKIRIHASDLEETLLDKGNLFKVDLVVLEINTDCIRQVRSLIDIPIIIVAKNENLFDNTRYDQVYSFYEKKDEFNGSKFTNVTVGQNKYVKDLKNNVDYSLKSLKEAILRDKKINDILG